MLGADVQVGAGLRQSYPPNNRRLKEMNLPLVAAMHTRRCVKANSRCCRAHASSVSPAASNARKLSSARWEPGSSMVPPLSFLAVSRQKWFRAYCTAQS
jgi:hypothetical protein